MSDVNKKPIVFDIEIKEGSPVRSPPIALKLKMSRDSESAPSTLEDIQEKLLRAEVKRREEFARKACLHTEEKRQSVLMRKMATEKGMQAKYKQELEQKTSAAEQHRFLIIEKRIS
jgi:hypothetical protein